MGAAGRAYAETCSWDDIYLSFWHERPMEPRPTAERVPA
jgi:hypothetical protein